MRYCSGIGGFDPMEHEYFGHVGHLTGHLTLSVLTASKNGTVIIRNTTPNVSPPTVASPRER